MSSSTLVHLSLQPINPDYQFRDFPTELAESVIDALSGDARTLRVCVLVCRAWYFRARFHLLHVVRIKTKAHSDDISDYLQSRPLFGSIIQTVIIGPSTNEPTPWMLLGTVLITLFPRLPSLRAWTISSSSHERLYDSAPNLEFHRSTLACLHASAAVEHLRIGYLQFASCPAFVRFVTSLRGLRHLECERLVFSTPLHPSQLLVLTGGPRNRLSLSTLRLGEVDKQAVDVLLGLGRTSLEHLHLEPLLNTTVSQGMLTTLRLSLPYLPNLRTLRLSIAVVGAELELTTAACSHYAELLKATPPSVREVALEFQGLHFHQLAGSVYLDDDFTESFGLLDDALSGLHLDSVTLVIPSAKRNRIRFWKDILTVCFSRTREQITVVSSFPDGAHLSGHDQEVIALAISHDSRVLATASSDNSVLIWDLSTRDILHELVAPNDRACALAFSPDSLRLAYTDQDAGLTICDVLTGDCIASLDAHAGSVTTCAWSPDGARLVTGGEDSMAYVWNAEIYQQSHALAGHVQPVGIVHASFSPDGDWLVLDRSQQPCQVWSLRTHSCVLREKMLFYQFPTAAAVFSPSSRALATAQGTVVCVWDVETGEQCRFLEGHSDIVSALSFSPDGSQLLSASYDSTVRIWDTCSGTYRRMLQGHTGSVFKACFSPNGKYVASASEDATVRVWRESDGVCIMSFTEHQSVVRHLAFSPDGTTLSSAAADGSVCIRQLAEHLLGWDA